MSTLVDENVIMDIRVRTGHRRTGTPVDERIIEG